jgi:hypothetical protein
VPKNPEYMVSARMLTHGGSMIRTAFLSRHASEVAEKGADMTAP